MDDAVEWWMMLCLLDNLVYDGANNCAIMECVLLAHTMRGDMTKEAIHSINQCHVPQGPAITCLVYMHTDFMCCCLHLTCACSAAAVACPSFASSCCMSFHTARK